MTKSKSLSTNSNGASALEFALVAPILVSFLFGFFHLGLTLWADAGLKAGVGEASRLATLYPARTDAQIKTRFNERVFGTTGGTLSAPAVTRGTDGTQEYVNIAVTYAYVIDPIIFPDIPVTLSESRRTYIQS